MESLVEPQSAPTPPPGQLPYGSTILGKYEITNFLGRGSFAKVYQAKSLVDDSIVAIKIIDKIKTKAYSMESRIISEIHAMRRVHNHPNILKIYEVLASKTKIYLVLEYAAGGDLFSKIEKKGRLSERLVRHYFQQLVSALCFCHSNGVFHRDLKPQNLLLDKEGNLKVSDFGLSALPEHLKNGLLKTCCGTPAYAAPELHRGHKYDGAKADAWSCGVILHVMLAGRIPFDHSNYVYMLRNMCTRNYKFSRCIPKVVVQSVMYRLLDPNPMTRMKLDDLYENTWFKRVEGERSVMKENDNIDDGKGFAGWGMNAFDIISMSKGFDLRGLLETTSCAWLWERKKEKRFLTNVKRERVVERVVEIGGELGFESEIRKNGSIRFGKDNVNLLIEIFELLKDQLLMVQVNVADVRIEFEEHYWKDWKSALESIVLSWHNDSL